MSELTNMEVINARVDALNELVRDGKDCTEALTSIKSVLKDYNKALVMAHIASLKACGSKHDIMEKYLDNQCIVGVSITFDKANAEYKIIDSTQRVSLGNLSGAFSKSEGYLVRKNDWRKYLEAFCDNCVLWKIADGDKQLVRQKPDGTAFVNTHDFEEFKAKNGLRGKSGAPSKNELMRWYTELWQYVTPEGFDVTPFKADLNHFIDALLEVSKKKDTANGSYVQHKYASMEFYLIKCIQTRYFNRAYTISGNPSKMGAKKNAPHDTPENTDAPKGGTVTVKEAEAEKPAKSAKSKKAAA